MRYIANSLTMLRVFCSIALFFLAPFSTAFLGVYSLAGITDALDGYFARKTNTESDTGATLDSIADAMFTAVILFKLLPIMNLAGWVYAWLAGIVLIKAITLFLGIYKFHTLAFLHTYMNKAAGVLLFCFPFLYLFIGLPATALVLCSAGTLAAVEELLINGWSKELVQNIKSIIFIKRI